MKTSSLILLLCAVLLLISLTVSSFADFGDFGGDNDFGGGGDYDYGYNGGGGHERDDRDDDHYRPSYRRDRDDDYDSGESDEVGWVPTVIVLGLLAALIVWGVLPSRKKSRGRYKPGKNRGGKKSKNYVNVGDRSTPDSELRLLTEYAAIDPDFDVADLREKASDLYVRMQNCWTKGDISGLRPYFTDALFTQFERQLAQKRAKGLTNHIERISVQNVTVRGFRQESGVDHMIIRLEARIIDYTVDDAGNVVSGSKDSEKIMTYEWDMSRTSGVRTLKKDGVGRVFCPACGAPVDINASARCEYCGSVLQSSGHDWAICSIKALSQKTV